MSEDRDLSAGARVLLVQLCDPRRFLYLAERLLGQRPDWRLEGLAIDHPYLRQGAGRLNGRMRLHLFRGRLPKGPFDRVLVTPAEPGSRHLREAARALSDRPWRIDLRGELSPLHEGAPELLEEPAQEAEDPPPEVAEYVETFPPILGGTVLLLECCHPSLTSATEPVWRPLLAEDARPVRLPGESWWKARRTIRRDGAGGLLLFVSGEPGYFLGRWVPFFTGPRPAFLVDEEGNLFPLTPAGMFRYVLFHLRRGRLEPRAKPRIALLETEAPPLVAKVPEALHRPGLFPGAEIVLLCRREKLEEYRLQAVFDRVEGLPKRLPAAWRMLRRLDVDLVAAFHTGRSDFRTARRLLSLPTVRNRLLFDGGLRCLRPGKAFLLRWLGADAPLPEETVEERDFRSVLLIQTEGDEEMAEAARRLTDPKVVPKGSIRVFCREDRRRFFERLPGIDRVFTYRPGDPLGNLKTVLRLCLVRFDVAAAMLSERPVFRKQKLLFFTLPARSRLVFNRHLDAFYLRPSTLALLFPVVSHRRFGFPFKPFRTVLKATLLFPRFLYLVIWVTLEQIRRRYTERR